jgi:hypothetical protein
MRATSLVIATAATAVLMGAVASSVTAAPPATATGTFQIPAATDNVTLVRTSGGNLFFHEVAPLINSGEVTGDALDVDNFVVHADGTFEGAGVETCDACTLAGRTGSYTAMFTFHGSGDNYTGLFHFISGGGGLAGLHGGGGSFAGTSSGGSGTYSYPYLFS